MWFDREAIDIDVEECQDSISTMYQPVIDLIKTETDQGVPANRIVVGKLKQFRSGILRLQKIDSLLFLGGFSMGGALSLHTAYNINRDVAGVFGLSSFLNNDSVVYDTLKKFRAEQPNDPLPNLLMFHGERDSLVPSAWGKTTFDRLRSFGVQGEFIPLKNTMHELKTNQLLQVQSWIEQLLPPLESDLSNKL